MHADAAAGLGLGLGLGLAGAYLWFQRTSLKQSTATSECDGRYRRLASCVAANVTFGKGVTVVEPANLYGCTIGDGAFIGPFTEIQSEVVIGARSRVQSHAFVCSLVSVGSDCFISHGAMFINDPFSKGGPSFAADSDCWRPTRIGDRVSIGTNATVMPVTICNDVVIGSGSVVTKDIMEPGIYAGNPARKLR